MSLSNRDGIDIVYKIMPRDAWEAACQQGVYDGSPDDARDGFIHFSAGAQLAGTAEKHFRGQDGLVVIAFRAEDLGQMLRWEPSRGGALFPHLYGSLATQQALWVKPLELDTTGVPIIPEDLGE